MTIDYRIKSNAVRPTGASGLASTTVDYKLRLIQNLDENGSISTVDFPINQPENTQQLAFQGKTVEIPVNFQIYNHGMDMAAGTLHGSNIRDDRLSIGTVASVPDSATLRLNGDVSERLSTTDTEQLTFFTPGVQDADGDCTFDKTQVSYDDANDETVLNGVSYGTQPASGDFTLHSVRTVEEQIVYLKRHIQEAQFGTDWELNGGRFSDPEGFNESDGTPVALTKLNIKETADQPLRANGEMKLKVGEIIP